MTERKKNLKSPDSKIKSPEKMHFEEALAESDRIAEQIENGEIGLEDSITAYERGMQLIARCKQILAQSEQKIQNLKVKDSDQTQSEANLNDDSEAINS